MPCLRTPRAVLLLSLLACPGAAQERSRGLVVLPVGEEAQTEPLYGSSHALVLGVGRYSGGWAPLPEVEEDCAAVAQVLESHGFQVTRVQDPDRAGILEALERFRVEAGLDPEARLVVYFAGHGHSERSELLGETGSLVPVDAPLPSRDPAGFAAAAIEMAEIETYAKRLRSKHALFVFDSCFAGTLFTTRSAAAVPRHVSDKVARPVRQFITAGDADEAVPAVSVFRRRLVRALEGEGDVNGDGFITGSELGEYLHHTVTEETGGLQHPRWGRIRDVRLDAGDVVFVAPRSERRLRELEAVHVVEDEARAGRELEAALDLLLGRGGAHDLQGASRHLLRAAEAGSLRALALLAEQCYSGEDQGGVDPDQAWRLVQAPAAGGDLYGRFLRAKLQVLGVAGPDRGALGEAVLDELLAELESVSAGDPYCAYAAGYVRSRRGDHARALAHYRVAAAAGVLSAISNLGYCHERGLGVEQDLERAVQLFRRAAELGSATAMYNTGVLVERGRGVEADTGEAMRWYRRSAERGTVRAMHALGRLHLHGEGALRDVQEALAWLRRAADRDHAAAMVELGWMSSEGLGVPRSDEEAVRWYRRAAELGDPAGMYELGQALAQGRGVERDPLEADRWRERALEAGYEP